MRRARDNGLLKNENGDLIGINLGADYCAEHEWGIKDLKRLFGIKGEGYGLAKRTMTEIPMHNNYRTCKTEVGVYLIETKKELILMVGTTPPEKADEKSMARYELSHWDDKLSTAWDERSFGISARSPEDKAAVKRIYDAIQGGDLAIWLGGGGVFQNAGLVLAIASKVPADKAKQLSDADHDAEKLQKASDATGICQRLKDAGRHYFACSPRWPHAGEKKKTKHPVVYWLNPMEQDKNNYGWFTVEDLDKWIKNEGPIPMSDKEKANRNRR